MLLIVLSCSLIDMFNMLDYLMKRTHLRFKQFMALSLANFIISNFIISKIHTAYQNYTFCKHVQTCLYICILSENMIVSFFFVEKTFPIIIFV